jgi:hypothetical protein
MNKTSSNQNMEPDLNILGNINKVDVPNFMFQKVMQKVELQKQNKTLQLWVKLAAAAIVIIALADVLLISQNKVSNTQNQWVEIIPQQNHQLYGE